MGAQEGGLAAAAADLSLSSSSRVSPAAGRQSIPGPQIRKGDERERRADVEKVRLHEGLLSFFFYLNAT